MNYFQNSFIFVLSKHTTAVCLFSLCYIYLDPSFLKNYLFKLEEA